MSKLYQIFRNSIIGVYKLNYKVNPKLVFIKPFKSSCITPKIINRKNFSGGNHLDTYFPKCAALAISILTWLGFTEEDEQKESELITILKRAVLCTQREQYKTAEKMLHLALRIAQQQQNKQGELYCFDLMANLAFETVELDKAEKLFVTVLQMLLSEGMQDDDLKVIHISLKLARIKQLMAELDQAQLGYEWCLEKIEKQKNDNADAKMLYGVINDWYAQFLLDKGEKEKSMKYLKEAHRICQETKGQYCAESVLLLNDLGITSFRIDDMEEAEKYLREAVNLGQSLEDKTNLGVVHANLGLILLEKGILAGAEKACQEAMILGKKHEHSPSIGQASYCFDQIRLNLTK